MRYQGGYPLCMDCMSFDKESWGFSASNKGACRKDGACRWIGSSACADFICAPDSKVAAFAGGH